MGIIMNDARMFTIFLATSGFLLLIAGAVMPERMREILRTAGIILVAFLFPVAMILIGVDMVWA